jgi:alpha-L-rhamnosidase
MDLTVPVNTTATVAIPAHTTGDITENGHPITGDTGIRSVHVDHGTVTIQLGSGRYLLATST